MNKNILLSGLVFMLITLISSCSKSAIEPDLSVTATPSTVAVGEEVTFTIVGSAETFAIYPGDEGHEFKNSYMVITEGKTIDDESVVLNADSVAVIAEWLLVDIATHNEWLETEIDTSLTYIDPAAAIQSLTNLAGNNYSSLETAKYEISLFLPEMNTFEAWDKIMEYFTNNSVLLAPEGGFATGMAIDRYEKEFVYKYSQPGTYTATVIATSVGQKKYEGDGYVTDGTASASEYDFAREIKEVTIVVE